MLSCSPKGIKSEQVPNRWDEGMGKKLVSVSHFWEKWRGLPKSVRICINNGISSVNQVKNGWV